MYAFYYDRIGWEGLIILITVNLSMSMYNVRVRPFGTEKIMRISMMHISMITVSR